ncbi:Voltage-gated potassium channel subunit beta-2 [Chamberlinius hualienensis]
MQSIIFECQLFYLRNLGKSGLRVSNICLATWVTLASHLSDEVAEDIVTLAYNSGINVFDTSEAYTGGKTEILLGNILKKKAWRRSTFIVMTKIYWTNNFRKDFKFLKAYFLLSTTNSILIGIPNLSNKLVDFFVHFLLYMSSPNKTMDTERGLSRKHIIEGVQISLQRLQLNYIDVVFVNKADPLCPMEEIVRAFTYCINKGMIMYWGTARWSPVEIMEAYTVARQFNLIPPICEQMEYHMFYRDKAEINLPELYHKIGVGAMVWSPLVLGITNNKFDDFAPPFSRVSIKSYSWLREKVQNEDAKKQQAKMQEISQLAEKLGCSFSQLTVAWCLKNENVHCVIVGATCADHIYDHIQALQIRSKLNTALMAQLDAILDNKPVRTLPKR